MPWDDEVDAQTGGLLDQYASKGNNDAYFTEGMNGPQIYIEVLLTNPEDHPNIPDGICKNWYGCGPDWTIIKNGAEVTHPTMTKFNNKTEAGRLVAQMQAIDPDGATLANGRTVEASYWKSMGAAEWAPVSWKYTAFTSKTSGEKVEGGTKAKVMPVKLLGQPSSNGHAPADFDLASLQLSDEVLTGLRAAATASKSYSDFLPKAVSVAGLASTPAWGQISNTETGPRILAALKPF